MRIAFLASLAIFIVLYIYIVYIHENLKDKKENKEFLKKRNKLSYWIRNCPTFLNPENFLGMFNNIDTNTLNLQYFPEAIGRYNFIDEYKFTFKEMKNLINDFIPCLIYENIKGDEIIVIPNIDPNANPVILFDIVPRTKFEDLNDIGFLPETFSNSKTYTIKTDHEIDAMDFRVFAEKSFQTYKIGAASILVDRDKLQEKGFSGYGVIILYLSDKMAKECIDNAERNCLGSCIDRLYREGRFKGIVATYATFNPKEYYINEY